MWLTLLWHMGLHMPWGWASGPSYSNEREHFRAMLAGQEFPENTLFCADAGFTGYELWRAMAEAGHAFLIRVGSNVRLLRKLGYAREGRGVVYFWTDHAARDRHPPLVLRQFALQVVSRLLGLVPRPKFGHLAEHRLPDGRTLLCSYHPSQQNTSTGKLTDRMLTDVFRRARRIMDRRSPRFS